jgi:major membrane immunogen (membrane-anchored lipoprotein)
MLKKSILSLSIISSLLIVSCGSSDEKKAENDYKADAEKMCKCFEEGKNDSKKFMECSEENGKIREKYKDDNEVLTKYDELLVGCM